MANRFLRPNLIHRFSTVSPVSPPTTVIPEILSFDQPKPEVDLDLSDQARLFASVPISTLLRSTAILHATSIGPMVDLGSWLMSSKLMDTTVTRDLVLRIVKGTFYDHFCAGEDAAAAARRVSSVYESTGLKGMLVYGVEHAEDGGACDENIQKFIETVEAAKTLPSSHVRHSQIYFICLVSKFHLLDFFYTFLYFFQSKLFISFHGNLFSFCFGLELL